MRPGHRQPPHAKACHEGPSNSPSRPRWLCSAALLQATADEPWTRYSAAGQPAMGEAFESDDEDKSDGERALAREMRAAHAQRLAERGAGAKGPVQQAQEEAHEVRLWVCMPAWVLLKSPGKEGVLVHTGPAQQAHHLAHKAGYQHLPYPMLTWMHRGPCSRRKRLLRGDLAWG